MARASGDKEDGSTQVWEAGGADLGRQEVGRPLLALSCPSGWRGTLDHSFLYHLTEMTLTGARRVPGSFPSSTGWIIALHAYACLLYVIDI